MSRASTSTGTGSTASVDAATTLLKKQKKPFPILAKSTQKPASSAAPGVPLLPLSRIHRIIKADRDIKICSKEAIFLMSKATEFMIGRLTNQAHATAKQSKRAKTIKYQDLAHVVNLTGESEWFYLAGPIPTTVPLSIALVKRTEAEAEDKEMLDEEPPLHIPRSVLPRPTPITTASGKRRGRPKKALNLDEYIDKGSASNARKGLKPVIPTTKPKRSTANNVGYGPLGGEGSDDEEEDDNDDDDDEDAEEDDDDDDDEDEDEDDDEDEEMDVDE